MPKDFVKKKGGRSVHDFPSNFFCLQSAEQFCRGNLQCLLKLGYRKILRIKERAGITFLRPNCFYLTEPTYSVGEPFCVSQSFG